jgi:hypothetical protein
MGNDSSENATHCRLGNKNWTNVVKRTAV